MKKKSRFPLISNSLPTTPPLNCVYIIIAAVSKFDVLVGEMTTLAFLLDLCFDLVSLSIKKLFKESVSMADPLGLLFFN